MVQRCETKCFKMVKWRKEARNQWFNGQYNREKETTDIEYHKSASKIFRNEKRKHTRKLLEKAESDSKMYSIRQLYQKINSIRVGYRKHNQVF